MEIRKGKRLITAFLAIVVMLLSICSCSVFYREMKNIKHKHKVEVMKTLVPVVKKVYFENPTMINIEEEVEIVDGKYVLAQRKWTKLYVEIDVDERISQSWHSFAADISGFDVIGLQELSCSSIEENTIRRFRCSMYIRPRSADVTGVGFSTFTYFHTIDGEGWKVDCKLFSKSLPIMVIEEG